MRPPVADVRFSVTFGCNGCGKAYKCAFTRLDEREEADQMRVAIDAARRGLKEACECVKLAAERARPFGGK